MYNIFFYCVSFMDFEFLWLTTHFTVILNRFRSMESIIMYAHKNTKILLSQRYTTTTTTMAQQSNFRLQVPQLFFPRFPYLMSIFFILWSLALHTTHKHKLFFLIFHYTATILNTFEIHNL